MRGTVIIATVWALTGCSSCVPRMASDVTSGDAALDVAMETAVTGPQTCADGGGNPSFTCPLVASPRAGWRRIGCLPRCAIEIADDPSQSDPPVLDWQPCADGRQGCTEMRVPEADFGRRMWWFEGRQTNNDVLLWVVRDPNGAYGDRTAHLLSVQTNRVIYATRLLERDGLGCLGLPLATHAHRALDGFASWDNGNTLSGRISIDPATGAVEDPILRVFDYASCGQLFNPTDCAAYSNGMVCISNSRQILRWNDDQRRPEWLTDYSGLQGVPSEIRSVGEDVWFTTSSWDFDLTVRVVAPGQGVQRLVPAAGGDAFAFGADGVQMAWLEGIGRDRQNSPPDGNIFSSIELYVAPYTTDPARVQKRFVGRLPDLRSMTTAALGGGYFAYGSSNPRPQASSITVVRLSDGAYWRLHPGDGYEWTVGAPSWIGNGEIALGKDFLIAPQRGEMRSLQRIRLDALGAPDGTLPR